MTYTLQQILLYPEVMPDGWLCLPPPNQERWTLDSVGVFSQDSKDFPPDSEDYLPIEVRKYGWIEVLEKALIESVIIYTKNQISNPSPEQLLQAMIYYYENDAFLEFQI